MSEVYRALLDGLSATIDSEVLFMFFSLILFVQCINGAIFVDRQGCFNSAYIGAAQTEARLLHVACRRLAFGVSCADLMFTTDIW